MPRSSRPIDGAAHVLLIEQGGRGGVADYTAGLVGGLVANGARVELATATDHRYGTPPGVTIHTPFRYVRGDGALGRILRRLRLGRPVNGLLVLAGAPTLVRLARRVDIVHTQGWEYLPLGVFVVALLRLAGATVVQTEHNTFEREADLERARRSLARLTSRTIVHAAADVPRAYASERGHAVVIPHGEYGTLAGTGGTGDRAAARAELGIPPDAPAVILFGQLRSDKGLGDLLAAAREVAGLHVVIAGQDTGGLAAERAALAAPELAGRVHLREGFLEMDEAARLFAAADAAVLPYKRASQSGVLLLAYGFERPVVAYPVGGLVDAIEAGETGWLCASPDRAALAATLREVAAAGAEECLRRGRAGRRLADERYSWDAIAARTLALYADALGRGGASEAVLSAALLFAGELAEGTLAPSALATAPVLDAVRSRPVPPAPLRFAQLVRRRRGALDFGPAVAEPLDAARRALLGPRAAGQPRFLVRVDEFPHYEAWDRPDRYGSEAFQRFHAIMTAAGVPYLIAVPPRVSHAPLDPRGTSSRPLEDREVEILRTLVADGTTLALHGRDHRTRAANPRRHSELCGLDAAATAALLDTALAELADASLPRPEVFVPPFNRFEARQYDALAARFPVVCGGPESIALLGFHRTPLWRGRAVYLPSYAPLYGRARDVAPAARALVERQQAVWAPITLHWGWEADEDWDSLVALAEQLAPHAAAWEELLAPLRDVREGRSA